jgi:hypothetical protein
MGAINYLAVVLGAVAFFAVGALWYGVLFGKAWQRELGMGPEAVAAAKARGGGHMAKIMGLCFVAELVVAWMLGHLIARTSPAPHVVLMFAGGFGVGIMSPAIAINYLYQNRSLKLFLIDAGHFIVGMLVLGGVFVALG